MLHEIGSVVDIGSKTSGTKAAVLYFWASWCEPCGHMDTVVLELSKRYPDIAFCRVEAEAVDEVTIKYSVASVPTFVFLEGGHETGKLEGANPAALTARVEALASATTSTMAVAAAVAAATSSSDDAMGRIKYLLASHPVVLFMKGSGEAPRCGFSRTVVEELRKLNVTVHYVDILQDEELRAAVKEFGQWPTYPQLYVKGELIGGCDIIKEMSANGELQQVMVDKLGPGFGLPTADATTLGKPTEEGTVVPPHPVPIEAVGRDAVIARIDSVLASNDVMLFLKGTPDQPRCGFSRRVVEALNTDGIEFGGFDILGDEDVRQTLKDYKQWPTYPQLYVKGELVGGCDIITELHQSGELKKTVQDMMAGNSI